MFWWLIWAFIFIFVVGSDSRHWGSMWSGHEGRIAGMWKRRLNRSQTDYELRQHYRKVSETDVVIVRADDKIDYPDKYLERLIDSGQIDEAREYRLDMERMAEKMDDDNSRRKYAIYGARISQKRKQMKVETKKKQYYRKPDPTPAKKAMDVIPATPSITTGPIDPFGKTKTKPPLWSKKFKQPEVKPEPVSHLELANKPIDKPVGPPEIKKKQPPKPEMPDFSKLPPGPVEISGMSDYKPGPVEIDPAVTGDPKAGGITKEEQNELGDEGYENLIDI